VAAVVVGAAVVGADVGAAVVGADVGAAVVGAAVVGADVDAALVVTPTLAKANEALDEFLASTLRVYDVLALSPVKV